MKRISTGVAGLDQMCMGGFMEGSSVLLSGGAGTGKTLLSTQYIYNGAKDHGEAGVYVTLEEGSNNLWWNMQSFHWNITKFQQQNLIKIYKMPLLEPSNFKAELEREMAKLKQMVEECNAGRLVIDSTTALVMSLSDDDGKYVLTKLLEEIAGMGCTTIITSEMVGNKGEYSKYGEEYLVDAILSLYFKPPVRIIMVNKMRGSDHDKMPHPFYINANGIEVNPAEKIEWKELVD